MSLKGFFNGLFGNNNSNNNNNNNVDTRPAPTPTQPTNNQSYNKTPKNDPYQYVDINVGTIPQSVAELQNASWFDNKDFKTVAAATLCALHLYTTNKDASIEILNFLKGPSPLSPHEIQFLRDRLRDKPYLLDSYFKGSNPQNNYTPAQPLVLSFKENPYSRDNFEEGYIRLFVQSSGADTERYLTLRCKKSTGEWFAHVYDGILAGIRVPVKDDAWA